MLADDGYVNSLGDSLYDDMRIRKIYIRKGMDSHTEWMEGVPMVRRALVAKADQAKMTLDEWAAEYGVSTSLIIELLGAAMYVWERKALSLEELDKMKACYEGVRT